MMGGNKVREIQAHGGGGSRSAFGNLISSEMRNGRK